MARRSTARSKKRKARGRAKFRFRPAGLLPKGRHLRRALRAFRRTHGAFQVAVSILVAVGLSFAVNWAYQVVRKPSELLFPVSGTLYKTPGQTWSTYAPLFERHATPVITADFLAALAQVEGSGNPLVRTYWRWELTSEPFEIYRPASSAVGMYQITDGTFLEARRYCVHRHQVVEDGPWHDLRSCWFNWLYTRVVPSHAIELTSAYLDRRVAEILTRHEILDPTLQQKQRLAAVVHLCGAGAGSRFAQRGLRPSASQRCGSHSLEAYVEKVEEMQTRFAGFAAAKESNRS
jgi:hypothetical protein